MGLCFIILEKALVMFSLGVGGWGGGGGGWERAENKDWLEPINNQITGNMHVNISSNTITKSEISKN